MTSDITADPGARTPTGRGVGESRYARWVAFALLAIAAASGAGADAGPFEEPTVTTTHRIEIDGQPLDYTAETGRIAIRDAETGRARGWMFYIAYRVPSEAVRPLAFVWNGGPGANSSLLHFEAAGPRRLDGAGLVDNADTWLTDMDLVFVDPIGTGFSRPATPEDATDFYGTLGDVASVTEFVRAWRVVHGAEKAPLLLIGESWGAGRAGNVGYALEQRGVPVHALVLISGGAGLNDDPLPRPLRRALWAADLSATARHHGRLGDGLDGSLEAVLGQARRWAVDTYAPALERVDSLDGDTRDALAADLGRYTGMPPDAIARDSLALTPRGYREGLLADDGRRLEIFDMRRTVPVEGEDGSGEGTAGERGSRAAVITQYLRHALGYRTSLPYVGLEALESAYAPGGEFPASVGMRWNYATADLSEEEIRAAIEEAIRHGGGPPRMGPPLPSAAEAVGLNPDLRVWVAAGRYDSLNSCSANDERARRLEGAVAAAYTFACYEGGHMMYRDPQARTALARHLREVARAVD